MNLSWLWREKISGANKKYVFLPVDYIVLIYNLILAVSILIFHSRVSAWPLYLGFNLSVSLFILAVSRTPVNTANGFMRLVRRWYFLILLLFLYQETGGLVFLYLPGWLDNSLANLEYSIFGVHPNLYLQKFNIPILSEYFMFGYFAYFFLILSYALVLLFKKMHHELDMYVTTAALTFLVSFFLFNFFPIAGPRFLFRDIFQTELNGYCFVPLVNYVIKHGAAEGGSLPSTHTAASILILVQAWRYLRPLAYLYLPVVVGLVIGTFWGRFHYISDTIAGILMAIVCIIISDWLYARNKLGWQKIHYAGPCEKSPVLNGDRKCIRK